MMTNARIAAVAGLSLFLTVGMCPIVASRAALADEAAVSQAEIGSLPEETSLGSAGDDVEPVPATLPDGLATEAEGSSGMEGPAFEAQDGTDDESPADSEEAPVSTPVDLEEPADSQDSPSPQAGPSWGASASLSASSALVGQPVTVTPSAWGEGGFEYNYVWERDGWADWGSNLRDSSSYTPDASFSFVPSEPGSYTLYVDVVSLSTGESATVCAGTLRVSAAGGLGASASVSGGPYAAGSAVAVTPSAWGASGALEYNYVWERDGWAAWGSTLNATGSYTPDASWSFTPDAPGSYTLYVDVRDSATGEAVTVCAGSFAVQAGSWAPSASLSASSCAPGGTVTLAPSAPGASGPLSYNYVWQRDGWAEWGSTVKDTGGYTSEATYAFKPAKAGTYTLYVDVVDAASGQVKTVEAGTVRVSEGEWSASVELTPGTAHVGDVIAVSPALSAASTTGYTFNYVWQRDGWAEWGSTVKDTGSSTSESSWRFVPTAAGTYTFYIDVTSPAGVTKTVSKSLTVSTSDDVKLSASVGDSSIDLGGSLTVMPNVQGYPAGSLSFNYVWQRDGWADWGSTVKDTGAFTSDTSFSFVPQNGGTYHFYVDVAVDGRTVTTLDAGEATVKALWTAKGLAVSATDVVRPGGTVELAVRLDGWAEGLEYNYVWQRDDWADWDSLEKSGLGRTSKGTYSWTLPNAGRYTFYVDVYDPATGRRETVQSAQVIVANDWSSSLAGKTIEWLEAAHYTEGREGNDWDTVVIHISESSTQSSVDSTFLDGERQASTHFSVFNDSVHQYVYDFDTAWSVGNWVANTKTVSIEFVGTTENPPSQATMDTGAQLIAALCAYKGWSSIDLGNHIGVHKDYSSTECPATTDVPYIVRRSQDYLAKMLGR